MSELHSTTLPPRPMSVWSYFLDVDGTLVDLAATPDDVCFDESLLRELESLRKSTDGAFAIVSGRTIADLDRLFGAAQVSIAGQHGLERRAADGRTRSPVSKPKEQAMFHTSLIQSLGNHERLIVEDKGFSIAVHYRQVPEQYRFLMDTLEHLVKESRGTIGLLHGKFVVEAVPQGVGKGFAIIDYLNEAPFRGRRPVFIGDDITDEHAFAVVNRLDGISIKVGDGSSCAAFRLPSVAAVREWLGKVRL